MLTFLLLVVLKAKQNNLQDGVDQEKEMYQ